MARVFISYRHDVADATVARRIQERLVSDNHDVFLDLEKLHVGDRWNAKIQKELEEAEFFVALFSLSYLHSGFILRHELVPAVERASQGSLMGFFPVNLAYDGDPPAVVRDALSAIQYVKWRSADDTPRVVDEIARRLPPSDLLIRGAQSFGEADARVFERLRRTKKIEEFLAVLRTGSHILLRGVSGAGKTSFLKAGVLPALRPSPASVVELKEDSADELERVCASQPQVVMFDQFEQSLIRLAHDAERCAALDRALVAVGERFRSVFCIREEFRTAFEQLLPETERLCTSFLLQPFTPSEAVAVLQELLKNGRIEHDASYLPELCESLAEGVPRTVVPAILQVIAQQCRIRNLALNSATWQRLVHGEQRTIFEEHVSESVLTQLPLRIPLLSATRTLVALTNLDVKSEFKTVSQIAGEQSVAISTVQQTLDVAAGRARVVSIDSFTAADEPRYRLAHDLFVVPLQNLHRQAQRRRERLKSVTAGAIALTAITVAVLLAGARRDLVRSTSARAYANAITQFGNRELSALHAARAFSSTDKGDEKRAIYALTALRQSLALPPPWMTPSGFTTGELVPGSRVVLQGPLSQDQLIDGSSESLSLSIIADPVTGNRQKFEGRHGIAITADGNRIALAGLEGVIVDRSGRSVPWQTPKESIQDGAFSYSPPSWYRFNSDGSLLIGERGRRSGTAVWDTSTGRPIHQGMPQDLGSHTARGKISLAAGRERAIFPTNRGLLILDLRKRSELLIAITSDAKERMSSWLSSDGRWVATQRRNGRSLLLDLWNADTGALVAHIASDLVDERFPAGQFRFEFHDISSDAVVLGAANDEAVYVWHTKPNQVRKARLGRFDFHHGHPFLATVDRLRFSSDGSAIIAVEGGTASQDNDPTVGPDHQAPPPLAVITWSANTFQQRGPVIEIPRDTTALAFDGPATTLRALLPDGRMFDWDLRAQIPRTAVVAAVAPIDDCSRSGEFSSDGSLLLTGTSEGVWSRPLCVAEPTLTMMTDAKRVRSQLLGRYATLARSTKLLHDRYVALWWTVQVYPYGGLLQVIDIREGRELFPRPLEFDMSVSGVGIDEQAQELRVQLWDPDGISNRLIRHDLATGKQKEEMHLRGVTRRSFSGQLTSDDGCCFIAFGERSFELASLTRTERFRMTVGPESQVPDGFFRALLQGGSYQFEDPRNVVVQRPGGVRFRITTGERGVVVANADSGKAISPPEPRGIKYDRGVLSRDGKWVALLEERGSSNRVQIWDLESGNPIMPPIAFGTPSDAASFADGDTVLIILGQDGIARKLFIGDRKRIADAEWLPDLVAASTGMQLDERGAAIMSPDQTSAARDRLVRAVARSSRTDPNAAAVLAWLRSAGVRIPTGANSETPLKDTLRIAWTVFRTRFLG